MHVPALQSPVNNGLSAYCLTTSARYAASGGHFASNIQQTRRRNKVKWYNYNLGGGFDIEVIRV